MKPNLSHLEARKPTIGLSNSRFRYI